MKNILSSTLTVFAKTVKATTTTICTPNQKANLWPAKVLPQYSMSNFSQLFSSICNYWLCRHPQIKSLPQEPALSDHEYSPPFYQHPSSHSDNCNSLGSSPLTSRSMTAVNQMEAPAIDQTWVQHKDASTKAGSKRAHIFFYWSSNNATCLIYRYQQNGWPNPCALGISLIDYLARAPILSILIISSFESSEFSKKATGSIIQCSFPSGQRGRNADQSELQRKTKVYLGWKGNARTKGEHL